MQRLTEEQRLGVQSIRELLVEARSKLERLNLPEPVMSTSWARLSNAHADLGRLLENDRILERNERKTMAG